MRVLLSFCHCYCLLYIHTPGDYIVFPIEQFFELTMNESTSEFCCGLLFIYTPGDYVVLFNNTIMTNGCTPEAVT